MNNIILKSIIAATLILSVNVASARGASANTSYNYSRNTNAQIGITPANNVAIGGMYKIQDASGKVVLQGRIKSADTFYIPTDKLSNGTYLFSVDGYSLKQFSVND